tara:strand:- start:80 stop:286 length:207 start_codon:yes stop_codon:yes gene_type:complete
MKIFSVFCFNVAKKSSFFRARYLVLIYTPKEAHSRIFVTGGVSIRAINAGKKKLFLARRACSFSGASL